MAEAASEDPKDLTPKLTPAQLEGLLQFQQSVHEAIWWYEFKKTDAYKAALNESQDPEDVPVCEHEVQGGAVQQ